MKHKFLCRLDLQFFGEDPKEDQKEDGALAKLIEELKKKLKKSEEELDAAKKKLSEQEKAIAALLDGDEPEETEQRQRFWRALRNIKHKGG